MTVRQLDINGDWTFGAGRNNYLDRTEALAQDLETSLQSFLGDCFWALQDGLDWWNLLGSKNLLAVELAIKTTILNTPFITGMRDVSINYSASIRNLSVQYEVDSVYGTIANQFTFDINPIG